MTFNVRVGDRVRLMPQGRWPSTWGVILEYDQMHPVSLHEVRVKLDNSETIVRVKVTEIVEMESAHGRPGI